MGPSKTLIKGRAARTGEYRSQGRRDPGLAGTHSSACMLEDLAEGVFPDVLGWTHSLERNIEGEFNRVAGL